LILILKHIIKPQTKNNKSKNSENWNYYSLSEIRYDMNKFSIRGGDFGQKILGLLGKVLGFIIGWSIGLAVIVLKFIFINVLIFPVKQVYIYFKK